MTHRPVVLVLSLLAGPALALTLLAGPAGSAPGDTDAPSRVSEEQERVPDRDHDRARAALQAGEVKPLRDVVAAATSQFHGDMVEAELDRRGPFWIYKITLLAPDGSILKLYYDAATTALVKARGHEVERWFKGDAADFPDMAAARSAMHERMHEQWHGQWHQRWQDDGGPGRWFRRWWRGGEAGGGDGAGDGAGEDDKGGQP